MYTVAGVSDRHQVIYVQQLVALRQDWFTRCTLLMCGFACGVSAMAIVIERVDMWQIQEDARRTKALRESASSEAVDMTLEPSPGEAVDMTLAPREDVGVTSIYSAYSIPESEPLGTGSFGIVLPAVDQRTGQKRAAKKIRKAGVEASILQREVVALRAVDEHPNVCRLLDVYETDDDLWLVMDLCEGGDLCGYLLNSDHPIPESAAANILQQMLDALKHCHDRGLIHRDVKPENLLFVKPVTSGSQPGVMKLIDFGFSVKVDDKASECCTSTAELAANSPYSGGTLLYMSPQALRGSSPVFADDVWSLGVIFHILLTGRFPFSTNDEHRFKELVQQGLIEDDVHKRLQLLKGSEEAIDLAMHLLEPDASRRITVEEALRHPFLMRKHPRAATTNTSSSS